MGVKAPRNRVTIAQGSSWRAKSYSAEKKAVENKPAVKTNDVKTNETSDMMSWLDSVYTTE